jgi:hypothetical protein
VLRGTEATVGIAVEDSDEDLWDINSIGDFTHHDLDYSIAILTRNDPDMAYGVDTVQTIASLINKAPGAGRRGRLRGCGNGP